jgi:hypothetical protein
MIILVRIHTKNDSNPIFLHATKISDLQISDVQIIRALLLFTNKISAALGLLQNK